MVVQVVYKAEENTEIFIGTSQSLTEFSLSSTILKYYDNDYQLKILVKYNDVVLFETPYTSINTNDIDNIIEDMINDYESQIADLNDSLSNLNIELDYWKTLYNNLSEQYELEKLQCAELIALKNDTIASLRDSILNYNPVLVYIDKVVTVIIQDSLDANPSTVIYKFDEPFENENEVMSQLSPPIVFENGGLRQFMVFDLNGAVVLDTKTDSKFHPVTYNIPSGTYFLYLRVTSENHKNHRLFKINYIQ